MNESTAISSVLQLLNPTNTISINRPLAHAIGIPETLIFSALISKYTYYCNRNRSNDGWFFSTVTDLQESTTYGEKAQKSAIKHLVGLKLIEYKLMGMPAKRFFRITAEVQTLEQLIVQGTDACERISNSGKKPSLPTYLSEQGEENASFSSSAILAEQVSTIGGTSSDDMAEQDPADGRNKFRRLGGTCSDVTADKSKVNNPKGTNLNINQSIYPEAAPVLAEQQVPDGMDRIEKQKAAVKKLIDYDWFVEGYLDSDPRQRPSGSLEELNEIVDIMTECACSTAPSIRVSNQNMSPEVVKAQLMKLTSEHIEYVLSCLSQNTTEIRNIKAYLITALYNAPFTFAHFYSAAVRHDLPEITTK